MQQFLVVLAGRHDEAVGMPCGAGRVHPRHEGIPRRQVGREIRQVGQGTGLGVPEQVRSVAFILALAIEFEGMFPPSLPRGPPAR